MLSRRDFLTRIFGGLAATAVIAALPKPVQALADEPIALSDPEMLPTFEGALDYLFACFKNERARLGWPLTSENCFQTEVMLGESLPNGMTVAHQLNIGFDRGQPSAKLIAQSLAESSVWHGMNYFGTLPIPRGCEYAGSKGPLRLVVQYSVIQDVLLTHADIIGATSLNRFELRRHQYRLTGQDTKRRLLAARSARAARGQAMNRMPQ